MRMRARRGSMRFAARARTTSDRASWMASASSSGVRARAVSFGLGVGVVGLVSWRGAAGVGVEVAEVLVAERG